ncbi:MAG: hypothetical protein D6806_05920 [Deltaproteobacteria bacterium]|nr:MAG: hypothetical protein D6806_05920 [Deltaproteobacteria bacterium]
MNEIARVILVIFFGQAVASASSKTLRQVLSPPEGFERVKVPEGSFGDFLRNLPVLPEGSPVLLHDGRPKARQDVHLRVIDIDLIGADLQQCADAVMRLRAEYLWKSGRSDDVCFHFTSGDAVPWRRWRRGWRVRVAGSRVEWVRSTKPDSSYRQFRRYLRTIFTYAGSASLQRELKHIPATDVLPGDVLIRGGHPGHAMLVVDVVENERGERRFALAQSYMPAQQIHVVRVPGTNSPWYPVRRSGPLETPEWRFDYSDFYRFPERICR